MAWQRVKIPIPKDFNPEERKAIADEVIDYIVDRTKKGLNKNNRSFPGYSDSYVKSLDFKIAGKSRGNVNLTLSGDMLSSLELLSHKSGELTIGFEKSDKENNDKATGHITGKYGNSSKTKKRDFLGITKKDLNNEILINYDIDDRARRSAEQEIARERTDDN